MRRCYSNDFFCARIRVPEASETDAFSVVVVVVVVAISPGGFPTQQHRRLFLHCHARDNFTRPGKTRDFVSLWPNSSLQRSFSEGSPFSPSRLLSPKFWFLSKSLPKLGWPWTHRMFWMFFDILAMSNCFSRRFRFRFYQWIQPRDKTKWWNYSKLAYEILRITLLPFVAESQIGTNQDRESVERSGLREQKEGGWGPTGRAGERPSAGRQLQGGGYFRTATSSSTSLFREDHGESLKIIYISYP